MATTRTQTQTLPFGAITVHRAVRAVESVVERVLAWQRTRRTVATLRRLSPAQLEDIGLTQGDIDDFSRTGRW